jgi:acetyltransferase
MFCPIDSVYPVQYDQRLTLKHGKEVFLRPIVQTDEALILDLLNKLSADSIYLRFLRPVNSLPEEFLYQLPHINYTSNFALVAVIREEGRDALVAVARYGYDAREKVTDFAIVVRDDWQRLGLGKVLLQKIFAVGRRHGFTRFVSVIDSANSGIKHVLRELDWAVHYSYRGGATQVEVEVE